MKKTWVEPRIEVQKFVPQEYVAACVTGMIACAIPGRSAFEVNDGTSARSFDDTVWDGAESNWSGQHWHEGDGLTHGICGESTSITFSDVDGTGSGFEMNHGVLDTTRKIYNISGYTLAVGSYNVIWNSQQDRSQYVYKHYGTLTITNIDNDRPNHS